MESTAVRRATTGCFLRFQSGMGALFLFLASFFCAHTAYAQTIFSDGFEGEDTPKFPPTISEIANTSTDEDTATGEIGFTVDDEKELDLLQVSGDGRLTSPFKDVGAL